MISSIDITLARIAIALVAVALIANLGVSTAVVRSAHYSLVQKIAQVCIIWLLPLIGALLAGVFLETKRNLAAKAADVMTAVRDRAPVQQRCSTQDAPRPARGTVAFRVCAAGTC